MADISKARRLIELTKGDRKILVTLWEGDKLSSCVAEDEKEFCETCGGDDTLCEQWIQHLEEQGYTPKEIELGELEPEESLPRFIEGREVKVEPKVEE